MPRKQPWRQKKASCSTTFDKSFWPFFLSPPDPNSSEQKFLLDILLNFWRYRMILGQHNMNIHRCLPARKKSTYLTQFCFLYFCVHSSSKKGLLSFYCVTFSTKLFFSHWQLFFVVFLWQFSTTISDWPFLQAFTKNLKIMHSKKW